MIGLFKRNLSLHAKTLSRANGEKVSYNSGTNVVRLTAVRGASEWEESAAGDTVVDIKTIDFLFELSGFKWSNGSEIKPMKGDFLTDANGARFEIVKGSNASFAAWTDSHKTMIRIHTIQRFES